MRSRRSTLLGGPAALAVGLVTTLVRAEEPAREEGTPGSWGYWVAVPSVVVGGGVTAYGLTLDCAKGDDACRWSTSLTVWGGLAVASIGSMVGLAIVHDGKRRVRVSATVTSGGLPVIVAGGRF